MAPQGRRETWSNARRLQQETSSVRPPLLSSYISAVYSCTLVMFDCLLHFNLFQSSLFSSFFKSDTFVSFVFIAYLTLCIVFEMLTSVFIYFKCLVGLRCSTDSPLLLPLSGRPDWNDEVISQFAFCSLDFLEPLSFPLPSRLNRVFNQPVCLSAGLHKKLPQNPVDSSA